MSTADAAKAADVMMILVPDHMQGDLYETDIEPNLTAGKTLMFAHGFTIHFGTITPPADVDVSHDRAQGSGPSRARTVTPKAWAFPRWSRSIRMRRAKRSSRRWRMRSALGCLKAGVIETTFKEETESDLFGEQAVLCGGVSELIRAGFETLVEAGYAPEIAYFECLHELKLIVDLIYEGGLSYMRYSVSDTAEYGDYTRGPRIDQRADARRDEEDSVGDSIRRVRARLDRGEQERPQEVPGHARSGAEPADREGRRGAAQDDAVPQEEKRSRSTGGLVSRRRPAGGPYCMRVFTFDTTLRDGTQGEAVSFSADDKVLVAHKLDELGIDYIEGGWPGSNPKDKEFFARAKDRFSSSTRG